jgi:hypothetical protein
MLVSACGGDDDDATPTPAAGSPAATSVTGAAVKIGDLAPDLKSLGFTQAPPDPTFPNTDTSKVVFYQNPTGKVKSIRLDMTLAASADAATAQFPSMADARAHPPPGLCVGDAALVAGTAVFQGDQSRSYHTDKPDQNGLLVYSDIQRFGRAIVIMYTIGPAGSDTDNVRKQVAQMISAKAPK